MAAGYGKNRSNAQCASGVLPGRREEMKFFAAGGRGQGRKGLVRGPNRKNDAEAACIHSYVSYTEWRISL